MKHSVTNILLSLIFLTFQYFTLEAQEIGSVTNPTIKVRGLITESKSDTPLPFVNIVISGPRVIGCSSDTEGRFGVRLEEPGIYSIAVSYLGYEDWTIGNLKLDPGSDTLINIELEPSFIITDEVVITATRKSQTLVSAPVSVDIVSRKSIESQNVVTMDQAFDGITGVDVTRSSRTNVQALSIRGASEVAGGGVGNRVLLLIDGRPALSPDSGGALWNLVPVNSIEKIEIVKGAYSSLFGSSAMGGVINVITKEPKGSYYTRINTRYGFYDRAPTYTDYDNFGDFYSLDLSHSNKLKNGSYLLEFSKKSDDGHREKSSFDQYNFYGKYHWRISNNKSLKISGNYNKINNDTPATWLTTTKAYSVAPHRKDDFQDREEYNADIYYSAVRSGKLKYTSRLYYYRNNSIYSFNDNPDNDTTNVNIGTSQIYDQTSIMAQRWGNVTQIDFNPTEKHYIIGGIEGSFDKIVALPANVLYGRHKAYNIGVYLQEETELNEKLIMTAGARYDYYNILNEFSESNLSPKISFVYNPTSKLSFRTLFGQAFRNPSIAERFIKFEQGGGLEFVPNPDLKSEKLKLSVELGGRYRIGNKGLFDLAFFYNDYSNLISYLQVANPEGKLLYQVVNLNKAVMQGFETSISYTVLKDWNVRLAYTYLDAKDTSDDRLNSTLAYKRKHSIHLNTTYNYKELALHFNARYKSRIDEVFIYPGSEPEGYFLADTRVDYKFKNRYRLFFTIDNISDTQYEEIERYRMPGRSYSIGCSFDISGDD
ncbi:MAG: TonB-dependent receptor [Bacteroidia bacterium]|nr:TonB-dependent receptor [Bacteroidia bacterium]